MAIVRGRHIRHDWRTFNDRQDQKSVRTLCGRTSSVKMSGIPNVTRQKSWLYNIKADTYEWGWCVLCTKEFVKGIENDPLLEAHPKIMNLYSSTHKDFVIEANGVLEGITGHPLS